MAKTFLTGHLQASLCDPFVNAWLIFSLGNQYHASEGIQRWLYTNQGTFDFCSFKI
jgi:hypothetical protein